MKPTEHGEMTEASEKFFEEIHNKFFPLEKLKKLSPSLITHCNRLTLCSKDSSERVTIDFNITTTNLRGNNNSKVFQNAVIIESKASTQDCLSSKILKHHEVEVS
jgi:VTC domain